MEPVEQLLFTLYTGTPGGHCEGRHVESEYIAPSLTPGDELIHSSSIPANLSSLARRQRADHTWSLLRVAMTMGIHIGACVGGGGRGATAYRATKGSWERAVIQPTVNVANDDLLDGVIRDFGICQRFGCRLLGHGGIIEVLAPVRDRE